MRRYVASKDAPKPAPRERPDEPPPEWPRMWVRGPEEILRRAKDFVDAEMRSGVAAYSAFVRGSNMITDLAHGMRGHQRSELILQLQYHIFGAGHVFRRAR